MASSVRVLEVEHVREEEQATPESVLDLPLSRRYGGANRRFMPRVSSRFSVLGADGERYVGIDLSFGGMMCVADVPVWPGNSMGFAIDLPGQADKLVVEGRVVELVSYSGQVAMRVRFAGVSNAERKRLAMWMANSVGHL